LIGIFIAFWLILPTSFLYFCFFTSGRYGKYGAAYRSHIPLLNADSSIFGGALGQHGVSSVDPSIYSQFFGESDADDDEDSSGEENGEAAGSSSSEDEDHF
jgi:hypothetical protein